MMILSCGGFAPVRRAIDRLAGRVAGAARRLAGEERGAVAVMFAMATIPLMGLAGAALDYSRASNAQTFLLAAADAAAVAMVNSSGMDQNKNKAKSDALKIFEAQAASVRFATDVVATLTITETSTSRTATVSFTANVPTTLMGLLGIDTVPISGSVASVGTPPIYMDFYMLLDNTPSMGVAATTADIATMVAKTSDQCAFACHIAGATNDYYALAKSLGVQMRIDVVRSASQQLMDTATNMATVPGQFRAAVYTFGSTCVAPMPTAVAALSSNLSSVKSSATAVDLMTIPYQGYNNDQCSNFDATLAAMNLAIPLPGDGSSALLPQKVLFLVSDGVADVYKPLTCTKPTTDGRCQEPIDVTACTALKARGIKIAVLYTTYLPLPTNGWYNQWIAPFASSIGSNMSNCASPGLYTEVSPSQGISEAMTKLFQTAVATSRLTK